jgi:hypothetical protein
MSRTLTASDRKFLIRLASTLPKGSPERKAILAGLQKTAAGEVGPYIEFDGKVWVSQFGDPLYPRPSGWTRVTLANKKTGAPGKKEYEIKWRDNGELSLFKNHRNQPVFKWKDLGYYPIPYTEKDFRADYKGYKSKVEPMAKTLGAEIKKKGGGAEMARGFAADVAEDVNFHSLSRALGGSAPEGLSMDEQDVGAKLGYDVYGAAFFALALAKVFRDKSMAESIFRAMKESEERSQSRGGREMMRERGFR